MRDKSLLVPAFMLGIATGITAAVLVGLLILLVLP